MTPDPILHGLNAQQLEAVTAPDRPLLIVAGPGSGKTRVITRRVAFLIRERGYRPWEIFAATFTNKAAEEMKRRICDLLTHVPAADLHVATFHSLCARILRREYSAVGLPQNFVIADERDQLSALKHVMRDLGISDKTIKPSHAQEVINQCKIRMLDPEDVDRLAGQSRYREELATIYEHYQAYLRASGAVDFEDLILWTVKLFTEHPEVLSRYQERYRHVMVDEFQDINASQFALVRLLTAAHHRLTVVGDEDQTIYSWRGASTAHILEFEKLYPERILVRLEQNYRSTGNILAAARSLIEHNRERYDKDLTAVAPEGPPVFIVHANEEREEAQTVAALVEELHRCRRIPFSDMAVFYRIGALSRVYEEALRQAKIPYRIIGGVRFYERAEVKDMLAYLQVAHNPHNTISLLRIANVPRRGLGDKTLEKLLRWSRDRGVSLFTAMEQALGTELVPPAPRATLAELVGAIRAWHEAATSLTPSQLYQRIRQEISYDAWLGDPTQMEVRSRIEHLDELGGSIADFEREHPGATLADYLENVSLLNPTDELRDVTDAVPLMTLHMAKGLEFRCVFVVACNDGLLPYARAVEEGLLEEERRLMYVGMTRAREILVLSHSSERMHFGERDYFGPSPFLRELSPQTAVELYADEVDPARLARATADGGGDRASLQIAGRSSGPPRTSPTQMSSRPGSPGTNDLLGKRVRHPLFGEGRIVDSGGLGKARWCIVETNDGQRIKLLMRFARLEEVCE